MKHLYTTIGLSALLLLSLASCRQEAGTPDDGEIRITAQHPDEALRAVGSGFETGDAIGLFVTKYEGETPSPLQIAGNYAGNISSTLQSGGKWSMAHPIYWQEGYFDLYAYYPYDRAMTSVDAYPFFVRTDQNSSVGATGKSGYEMSDLLYAKATHVSKADGKVVPLTFRHLLSKLTIRIIKGKNYHGELPTDAEVYVHNTNVRGDIDLASGESVVHRGTIKSIHARQVSSTEYEAVIIPQRVEYKVPLIEIITKGVSYMIDRSFTFRPGTHHEIGVILSDNPEQIRIEIGGEKEGWK